MVSSMGQIEILKHLIYTWKLLTVCKQIINIKMNYRYYTEILETFNSEQANE